MTGQSVDADAWESTVMDFAWETLPDDWTEEQVADAFDGLELSAMVSAELSREARTGAGTAS